MKIVELVLEKTAYGWSPEELHFQHPYLSLGQIYSALAYYWDHKEALDLDIEERLKLVNRIQREIRQTPLEDRLKLKGYIDEFRISKGIARWTEDFPPPTEPYTAEPLPPPDFVLDDSNGFVWNLWAVKRDLRGIYMTGACTTDFGTKKARALYKWNGTFALNAEGGGPPNFTYLVKWHRKGQWIDSSGNAGTVRIYLSAEDMSDAADWEKAR